MAGNRLGQPANGKAVAHPVSFAKITCSLLQKVAHTITDEPLNTA